VLTRFGRVHGQRFVGIEVQFAHADVAKFGTAHSKIAEAEGDVIVAELGEEPRVLDVWGE
jgi:hypothetical protein